MRTMHLAAAMAAALALSTPVSAGFFDLTLSPYIGAGAGKATSDISCPTGVSCDDSDTGWKIFGGLEVNEYISMEVGYIDLGEVTYSGTQSGTREVNGMIMDLVGTYAINPSFVLSARGGMNFLNAEVNGTIANTPTNNTGDTDLAWSFGLGAQYNLTPAVGLRLDWERFFEVGSSISNGGTGEADIDLLSAGVVYKF
ncbi:outer membrane beta-barrel protein [Thiobacillus sp.]|uniref:outer membrane beta-barrel protein n=1 Tax=Thiobacillus sp. TaxID=924 RepID=UPI0025E19DD1|nr:outer membrane beta-barrel protein [Thiobacillus sp.]MBT9539314.1 outer membrane beta-barrel protein [Thiobacillus sp.]